MARNIDLVTQFKPYVDEIFKNESKKSLLTNNDFDWTGAHTIKAYKVGTAEMNDYDREGKNANKAGYSSRFGIIGDLEAINEEMTLKKDRSFTFVVDKLDRDETGQVLNGASALARQLRQVTVPEIDNYTYGVMTEKAGHKPTAVVLDETNIYDEIVKGNAVLDNDEVPETDRRLVVTPDVYRIMKKNKEIILNTDIGADMRIKGVVANLDGLTVIKVPANRLPKGFGFMIAHPVATVAPTKLEDYRVHQDPPGISGELVEGRVCYDAFVLDNKACAIYYQAANVNTVDTVDETAGKK